ncbi:hypothetical protein sm9_0297 [Methanobrevibacter millerae]|uniref:Uncharacterized protein n=1 Tax=Methanobrevibacter millerae TaxID=230361 RepID=A0A0U2TQ39_9EURY|nr:hypothetical protein sm9_0297 [Methanobrevibacter millerae]
MYLFSHYKRYGFCAVTTESTDKSNTTNTVSVTMQVLMSIFEYAISSTIEVFFLKSALFTVSLFLNIIITSLYLSCLVSIYKQRAREHLTSNISKVKL